MTKQQVLSDLIQSLASCKKIITEHGDLAWKQCNYADPEPEIVKSFVVDPGKGVDYLNKNVATVFNASQSRFVLKFAGIFSHQKPKVQRSAGNMAARPGSATGVCELSDLVFLAVCVDSAKNVLAARAAFFQVKKAAKLDNQTQRWLYDYDAEFDYDAKSFWEKTVSEAKERTLPRWDEDRSSAFQYLLLESAKAKPRAQLSPWDMEHGHDFGFFLYRLVTMGDGKNWIADEVGKLGWSDIVDDMVRMAAGRLSTGKKATKDAARGSTSLAALLDHFNNFRSHALYAHINEGEPAVPMVMAIMQDSEQG